MAVRARYLIWPKINLSLSLTARLPSRHVPPPGGQTRTGAGGREYGAFQHSRPSSPPLPLEHHRFFFLSNYSYYSRRRRSLNQPTLNTSEIPFSLSLSRKRKGAGTAAPNYLPRLILYLPSITHCAHGNMVTPFPSWLSKHYLALSVPSPSFPVPSRLFPPRRHMVRQRPSLC